MLDKGIQIYEFRLGSKLLDSTINSSDILFIESSILNDTMNCNWISHDIDFDSQYLPIHPLLGLKGLNTEIKRNLKESFKYSESNWKEKIFLSMIGKNKKPIWKCMLLNGSRLLDHNSNLPYIIYSKRDQVIKKAPGVTSYNRTIDRFNVVEVMYSEILDGIEVTKYVPAKIMATLRFYDSNNPNEDLIMYIISYLIKTELTPTQLRKHPMDNIYMYHFHYGALWLDLIAPEEVRYFWLYIYIILY
jgi:hypothetical protein